MPLEKSNYLQKNIALIGVSSREEKFGFKIFRDLLKEGFKVKGVSPRAGEVLGNKIYRDITELEVVPDLVITVVPPEVTEKVVDSSIKLGVKEIWMQPGSESNNAIIKATDAGIKVVHHACFMVEMGIWR